MNAYHDEFLRLGGERMPVFDNKSSTFVTRDELVKKYAWAIPTDEALTIIARYSPIVEVGAGGGYWAYLLREQGVDVIATDIFAGQDAPAAVRYRSDKEWIKIEAMSAAESAGKYSDRTLFMCWPPYDEDMAYAAAKAFKGKHIIFIGEGSGGCTANDAFFWIADGEMIGSIPGKDGSRDYCAPEADKRAYALDHYGPQLYKHKLTARLPQWWGIHDRLYIYERL